MVIYLAGPMRGIPHFNFPLFADVSNFLRWFGHTVFNPAERDNQKYNADISAENTTGDVEQAAAQFGFNLKEALEADMVWICRSADTVALLPGWEKSKGAIAEKALAEALGLYVMYVHPDIAGNYALLVEPIDK